MFIHVYRYIYVLDMLLICINIILKGSWSKQPIMQIEIQTELFMF